MTEPDLTPSQQAMLKTLAAHGQAEIIDRDLATMTDTPYIFVSPTIAGAEGRAAVRDFYRHLMTQLPNELYAWSKAASRYDFECGHRLAGAAERTGLTI